MQDEVRDKSVAFVINVGKTGGRLTADLLKAAMRRYLGQSHVHHGKQSVKQLVRQGAAYFSPLYLYPPIIIKVCERRFIIKRI